MNMKRFGTAAMAVLFSLSVISCGSSKNEDSKNETTAATNAVTETSADSSSNADTISSLEPSSVTDTETAASSSSVADTLKISADWTSGEIMLDGMVIKDRETPLSQFLDEGWVFSEFSEVMGNYLDMPFASSDGKTNVEMYKLINDNDYNRFNVKLYLTNNGDDNMTLKDMRISGITIDPASYVIGKQKLLSFSFAGVGFGAKKDDVFAAFGEPIESKKVDFKQYATYNTYNYTFKSGESTLEVAVDDDHGMLAVNYSDGI